MSKKKLFDDDSEEDIAIKTENEYAKKYDTWRKKEEIYKLEQKYGPDALNSGASGSDSEDESDEPPEVSEEVEEQFLKTLALLKTKDPRIYDPNYKCFDKDEEKKPEEVSKPKTLTFDDSDDDNDNGSEIFKIEKKAEIDDTPKDNTGSPKKTKKEKKIKDYLTGKAEHIDEEVERDLAPLKALWSDPKLSEGEAFLRDYILNKRYLEDGAADAGEAAERLRDDAGLEADEQIVEEQSRFERAYNFRFEEPDDEYLKRFPRTVSSTRPKDERRARKRSEVRTRKEQEKQRKMEEIARLKALKLKDIQEKIAKIKEVTGNEDLAFKDEDIEGDFDPEEHDRRMKALFDEEYYGEADDQKPVFPDLDEELEIENWDNYEKGAGQGQADDEPYCEDEEFNMDADYDPKQPRAGLLEEIQKTLGKKRRNRKRKSKLAEILTVEKPKFIPDADKTYTQYMEEYYKLDCEDVIGGDLPTRFKYREVVPNDYGLTIEEILLADDKELTQWVPLKKLVRHRPEAVERGDVATYARRAADAGLKRRVLPSLFRDLPPEPELVVPVEKGSKKKKKKKKNKERPSEETDKITENNERISANAEVNADAEEEVENEIKDKKKKKKRSMEEDVDSSIIQEDMSTTNNEIDEENASKELISKKKKKKHKMNGNANNPEMNTSAIDISHDQKDISFDDIKSTTKKKKQSHEFTVESVINQRPSQVTSQEAQDTTNIKENNNKINKQKADKKLKRKLENASNEIPRKKNKKDGGDLNNVTNSNKKEFNKKSKQKDKFKNKNKFKSKQSNDNPIDNPLAKLSDERLKAYGLNPKKYRSFLKYKKF